MMSLDAGQIQAISAVATFLAAAVAVWATFRAPKLAAEFAETLRTNNQDADERRKLKLAVFTSLMQFRAQILNPNSIAALNLIDIVFIDAPEVREAWKDFHRATYAQPFDSSAVSERYHAIIEKMARDLKPGDKISIADIRTSYYPKGLGEFDEAAYLETQEKLNRFRSSIPTASNQT